MEQVTDWFVGGKNYTYHDLFHYMDGDVLMISTILLLCAGVFSGYFIIAWRWSTASKATPDSDAKKALNDLKWIFILCGICGYLWVCLESVWPAWRLYALFLAGLNFFTWRYVSRLTALDGVYEHLKDKQSLFEEISTLREQIKELQKR